MAIAYMGVVCAFVPVGDNWISVKSEKVLVFLFIGGGCGGVGAE